MLSRGHSYAGALLHSTQRGFFHWRSAEAVPAALTGTCRAMPKMRHVKGVDMSTAAWGREFPRPWAWLWRARRTAGTTGCMPCWETARSREGQVWEAAMAAAKYRLDNLCAVVDVNGLQIDGATADVMPSEPLDQKFEAFNWNVIRVDGHDYAALAGGVCCRRGLQGKAHGAPGQDGEGQGRVLYGGGTTAGMARPQRRAV